ncbi:hypothetical protein D9611_000875 [Ephemerocybe angulata]|uniref:LIM zinc-binding domain-containing protein n=1 Tax=Ephemerocybe angulata TaxID=980116 RepID=A0A8H5BNS8_9AGAR|nr:hypothetical protein D9611_000875 [Tulosesus angulatus]
MYGATPTCPRCEKLVYAAEQILGPGRKFYHKPCLTCMICNRRLDSYTLLEHDEQPYCKPCHLKNFGTRDLRHANLPYAARPRSASIDDAANVSPSAKASGSPSRPGPPLPPRRISPPSPDRTGSEGANGLPRLKPTRMLSPTNGTFGLSRAGSIASRPGSSGGIPMAVKRRSTPVIPEEGRLGERRWGMAGEGEGEGDTSVEFESGQEEGSVANSVSTDPTSAEEEDEEENGDSKGGVRATGAISPSPSKTSAIPTNTGRPGLGNMPRTVPLTYDHASHVSPSSASSGTPSSRPTHRPFSASVDSNKADDDKNNDDASPSSPQSSSSPLSSSYIPSSSYTSAPTSAFFSSRSTPAAAALNLLKQEGIHVGANGAPVSSPIRATPTGRRYGAALTGGYSSASGLPSSSGGAGAFGSGLPSGGGIGVQMTGTPTGTRYGAALGVQMTGSPAKRWGAATPVCPRCKKSVYFAEQVKAVGKTWHKLCMRCTECNTSLDSTKLRDHDEQPYCVRCYNKVHGPQGQGYALLGKAGG